MVASGGDAFNISKLVEENLMNDSHVGGGTISGLSAILSDLILLRGNQSTGGAADNVAQTVDFVQSLLQSLDTLVGACVGWQDIFNTTLRYRTATTYLT
jgi:hypothetical protein